MQSFISKICLINHHHAPFTYREIGCCVLTSQSSRFLAHVSAASQPLNLNSPCLPGSKVVLFSGFHFINSGLQSHSQGNICARPIVQTLQVKAKISAKGVTRPVECCCVGVGVVIVIIHIAASVGVVVILLIWHFTNSNFFNRATVHKRDAGYVRVPIVICDLRHNLFYSLPSTVESSWNITLE